MTATATVPSWCPYCSFWVLKLCIITITIRLLSPKLSNKQKKTRNLLPFSNQGTGLISQVSHFLSFAMLGAGHLPILQLGKSETAFLGPPAPIRVEGLSFSQLQYPSMTNSQHCKSQKVRHLPYQTCPQATRKPKSQKAVKIVKLGRRYPRLANLQYGNWEFRRDAYPSNL